MSISLLDQRKEPEGRGKFLPPLPSATRSSPAILQMTQRKLNPYVTHAAN